MVNTPPEILKLMAQEAFFIRQSIKYNSDFYLGKAKEVRKDIDSRYWSTFEIVRYK